MPRTTSWDDYVGDNRIGEIMTLKMDQLGSDMLELLWGKLPNSLYQEPKTNKRFYDRCKRKESDRAEVTVS